VELFDLEADPGETTDLSHRLPKKLAKLRSSHNAWFDQMAEPLNGGSKRWAGGQQYPRKRTR